MGFLGGFLGGSAQTFAIVAGFVATGLGAGTLASPARSPRGAEEVVSYTAVRMSEEAEPRVWLVDGFNALHVALLRGREREAFWTREARERLLALVRGFDDRDAEVWVVFDGPHPLPETVGDADGRPRVAFAESADEWLVRRAGASSAGTVTVVTADRRLAARARARGARVVSPHAFLARCAAPAP